ncbi:hypothetical protein QE152_g12698 [Popillia japonica]|uniref:Uncharacterized protein n=1 Tax=Popillia japonica TaxID=7064 RepID=A0AAW1LMD7_POPJA
MLKQFQICHLHPLMADDHEHNSSAATKDLNEERVWKLGNNLKRNELFSNEYCSLMKKVLQTTAAPASKESTLVSLAIRQVDITTYRFGLFIFHAWIGFFECIIHISFRLNFKNMTSSRRKSGNNETKRNECCNKNLNMTLD